MLRPTHLSCKKQQTLTKANISQKRPKKGIFYNTIKKTLKYLHSFSLWANIETLLNTDFNQSLWSL